MSPTCGLYWPPPSASFNVLLGTVTRALLGNFRYDRAAKSFGLGLDQPLSECWPSSNPSRYLVRVVERPMWKVVPAIDNGVNRVNGRDFRITH